MPLGPVLLGLALCCVPRVLFHTRLGLYAGGEGGGWVQRFANGLHFVPDTRGERVVRGYSGLQTDCILVPDFYVHRPCGADGQKKRNVPRDNFVNYHWPPLGFWALGLGVSEDCILRNTLTSAFPCAEQQQVCLSLPEDLCSQTTKHL